ncbi:MAG: DNA mismatch repair endonuclease MutL [Ktedonobacteraceae bacterium]
MPIRQLAPDVAAKIAAGEVVERPASVVKELIENSIDAGATQIRVDLMNGGLQLIRVTDNGSGIPTGELQLALARHATSKVTQIDDLEHIRSLGFRGEALASIAAVAEVSLLSHQRGATQGAQVSAINGHISDVSPAASPEGTTLTVRNLFSAVPARLKFLKSRHTEISHCHHMLEQYALAYPEIRFSVFSEGRQIFATPGDGQLSSVLIEIYGLQITEQMVAISSLDGRDDDPERPVVSGYTSQPACYKSTRQHISFFVNRRWVLSRILTAAVEEAYHSLLLSGRHPIAVVNITLDPTLLDVNVHPAKTEIRFLKERRVYAAVLRAVRQALLHEAEMPTWSNASRTSSTGNKEQDTNNKHQAPVDTGTQFDVEAQFIGSDNDADFANDPDFNSSARPHDSATYPQDNPWLTVTEEETGTKPPLLTRLWQSHVPRSEPGEQNKLATPTTPATPATLAPLSQTQASDTTLQPEERGEVHSAEAHMPANASTSAQGDLPLVSVPSAAAQQQSFMAQSRRLPALRVVGQLSQSYIVTEGKEGMYLIDQHAAHERILLERMVAALKARAPLSQMLLTPMQLQLAPQELEALEEYRPQLEHIGFSLDILEDNLLHITAVPQVLVKQMNARSLHELLVDLTVPGQTGHSETWEEHALANVACKAAIKANYFLTVSEMREMIEQLEQTNAPFSCCHGRPTMIHFSLSALEHEFERR